MFLTFRNNFLFDKFISSIRFSTKRVTDEIVTELLLLFTYFWESTQKGKNEKKGEKIRKAIFFGGMGCGTNPLKENSGRGWYMTHP